MNTDLLLHAILALLLLLIPTGALYLLERPQLKSWGIAIARMVVQLSLLCVLVWVLFRFNSLWLNLLWFVAMTVYAAFVVVKRCKQEVATFLFPVSAGMGVGIFLVGCWLLAVVMKVSVSGAFWFVPVMALLTGHTTAMMIRGLSTYLSALKADEQQYEFLRGNGLAHLKALKPFLRRSLLAVISPTMANISILGLTSMPLLLVGLFLGGLTPWMAGFLMLSMVAGCIAASVLSLALVWLISDQWIFKNPVKNT